MLHEYHLLFSYYLLIKYYVYLIIRIHSKSNCQNKYAELNYKYIINY